jgi:GxxExxY protein
MSLLYEQESYKIRKAAFDVYRELGCGHKETVYQKAIYQSLINQGLKIEKEKRLQVMFENTNVGTYIPDFIIEEKIIIELKAKPFLIKEDIKQFWQYLKGTEYKLGFLINFGKPGGIEIIRRVYDSARFPRRSA